MDGHEIMPRGIKNAKNMNGIRFLGTKILHPIFCRLYLTIMKTLSGAIEKYLYDVLEELP